MDIVDGRIAEIFLGYGLASQLRHLRPEWPLCGAFSDD